MAFGKQEFYIRGHKFSEYLGTIKGTKYRYCTKCKVIRGQERRARLKADGIIERPNTEARKLTMRKWHLKTNHGLTLEDFEAMLLNQNGCCALCGTDVPGPLSWNVDHNHNTGKVRGLLCQPCNVGLGNFKEDPELLYRAVNYLREPN